VVNGSIWQFSVSSMLVLQRFAPTLIFSQRCHRERRLHAPQMRELAPFLARYDMADRYVLSGCRFRDYRILLNPGVQDLLRESALIWTDTLREFEITTER
jgi:hypothetical protein